jgi:hypothetical protein
MEGAASFAGPGGTGSVSAGETVALNEAGPRSVRETAALFPRPQERFLNPRPGKFAVPFRWNRGSLFPETMTRLEVARDSAFSRIAFSGEFAGNTASVEFEPGSYFWRVLPASDEGIGLYPNILAFKILFVPAPALIAPTEGYRYHFRVKRPSVRFQWAETEEAAFYILEAADNPEMTNPVLSQEVRGTSFFFSGLGPGTWHWRARPVFPAGYEGTAGEGSPASFSVVQSAKLEAPELLSPKDQSMVNLRVEQGNIYFSWKAGREAESYRIKISANQDLDAPVIDEIVQENFYVSQSGRSALAPGRYYWAVLQTDIEGNDSAFSSERSFVVLQGEAIPYLVFPPDGYVVESSMLPDIRFSWRTGLPFPMRFQISKNPDFSSPFVDEETDKTTFQGLELSEGTWYWRVQSRGTGGVVFETPPRSFIAAHPVDTPLLLEPAPDKQAFMQEGEPLVFSWTASAGAKYYKFALYYGTNQNDPIYESSLIEETWASVFMDSHPEGDYRWTVRGFALETPRNGRRTGLLAEGVFNARTLRPVSLDYPGNAASFDGFQAYHEPETLLWSSGEPVGTSRFILSSRSDFAGPPLALIDNPPRRIALPKLGAGDYYWTIRAETPEGYDISAKQPLQFRVLPLPLLPKPVGRLPEDGKVIDAAELRANRHIVFSWDAVTGASGYLFALENTLTGRTVIQQGPTPETSLLLENLTLLDVGPFAWRVEAVTAEPEEENREVSGTIIQRGEIGENRFTIDFNLPGVPAPREPGILYGKK